MAEDGEATGRHCDDSSFISMLIYLFVCLFVCFVSFFSPPFQGTTLIWMEYRITLPVYLCLHLFVQRAAIVQSFLRRRREILKAIAVGLLRCHMTIFFKNGSTVKWFHA